ncbi:ATP-dependent DNA helicase PIF1-like protein, partial [Tanacetum coccineum]
MKQYPQSLSFGITINKRQGQSLSKVGLCLPHPVFTHEQLYVVVSKVKSKRGLKVVVCNEEGNISETTTNFVYKEINKLKMKVFVMGTHFEIGVKPQDMVVIRTTTTNMRLKNYTIE